MLDNRSSPAPRSTPSRAHSTASRPVAVRPPATNASQPDSVRALASIASTTHWAPNAAADRERDEHVVGRPPCELDDRLSLVRGRGDVEEYELVRARRVVAACELDRIAGVAQVDEPDPLDDAAAIDVEARDHTLVVHLATVEYGLPVGDREAAFVQRLAHDHGAEIDLAEGDQRAQVLERGHAARVRVDAADGLGN